MCPLHLRLLEKEQIQFELSSLVVPEVDATEGAGKLLLELPRLWAGATLEERRKLALTVLDAVYVDAKGSRSVVEVRVKGAFWEIFNLGTGDAFCEDRDRSPSTSPPMSSGCSVYGAGFLVVSQFVRHYRILP